MFTKEWVDMNETYKQIYELLNDMKPTNKYSGKMAALGDILACFNTIFFLK